MKITISANTVSIILTVIISFLVVAHCIQAFFFLEGLIDYVAFIDLDIEQNLPTFYSSMAIEFCAILLCIIYISEKQQNQPATAWLGLAIVFAFLGIDESTKIHENLGDFVEPMVNAEGVLYFPWVLPYGIAITIMAIIYIPWLKRLPLATAIRFIIAATLFLSGAIGFEILSATYADKYGTDSAPYTWTYTIEETLEMLAIMIFARALIQHISQTISDLTIRFTT